MTLPIHSATPPLLSVRHLCTEFPARTGRMGRRMGLRRAVDDVTFAIAPGETLGLVGESGCGKTTLARSILGLTKPSSGSVVFNGVDVWRASRKALTQLRRKLHVVFQDPKGSLNPRMRVGSIVAEPLVIHRVARGRPLETRVAELLERVGLRADHARRYPHELSGGQRQRVGIARAIAIEPTLIICDEPVSALDVSVQAQIINLLDDLQRALGVAYLFIAHNLAVVRHIAHRVAVMYDGRIIETADADDLFHNPRHPYTIALMAAVPEPDPTRRTPRAVAPPADDARTRGENVAGCAYQARCAFASARCRTDRPELSAEPGAGAAHQTACHNVDAVRVGIPANDRMS